MVLVADLIQALQQYDPKLLVLCSGTDFGGYDAVICKAITLDMHEKKLYLSGFDTTSYLYQERLKDLGDKVILLK